MVINWLKTKLKELQQDEALDELVTLIRVAQDNDEVKARLVSVLSLPILDRQMELDAWVESCIKQQAPIEFVNSIRMLRDPEIAAKALQVISEDY